MRYIFLSICNYKIHIFIHMYKKKRNRNVLPNIETLNCCCCTLVVHCVRFQVERCIHGDYRQTIHLFQRRLRFVAGFFGCVSYQDMYLFYVYIYIYVHIFTLEAFWFLFLHMRELNSLAICRVQ